jgi:hypothetical protein
MKASDICIGDWFKAVDYNSPFRITAIYDDVVQTQADYQSEIDGNWYSEAEIKDLVPIGLTDDILVKNGFDFTKRNYYVCCKEDKYGDVELSKDKNGFYWSINCDEYEILRIDYVHQLQHILTIAGVQKEIEL